jgi:glycosyltransferase involved in cell wall biosynthesis
MSVSAKEDIVGPLEAGLRPLLIPEIAVKLALGAKVRVDAPEVTVAFEGDAVRLHMVDFELASKIAKRIGPKIQKAVTRTAVINAVMYAQQFLAEDLFRPDATRILFYTNMSKASAFYRCLMPHFALNQGKKCVAHCSAGKFSRAAFEYDVIVFQIDNSQFTQSFAQTLKGMGKKVVYELDDAFDCLEPWHPQYASYGQPERQKSMIQMMGLVDAVQVSTPWLAEHYAKYAQRVEVIPNLLELAAWPAADRLRKDEAFKVVWAGSPSHSGDLREVMPALSAFARAHPDVKIVLFGQELKDTDIPEGQLENMPWCEFEEYAFRLAAVDADVSIAPLADVPFNHGKSNLRILQMWATGYPVIASNVGPYAKAIKNGKNGLLCSTSSDWLEALEDLYRNQAARLLLAASGIEAVKAYDVLPNVPKIEAFYSSLTAGG